MKTRYPLLSSLALAIPLLMNAQEPTILLTNAEGETVNGTVVHLEGPITADPNQVMTQPLGATNLLDFEREINVKRYELDVIPGTRNYFCWALCYDPVPAGARELWFSMHTVMMGAGQQHDGFYADYMPDGIEGSSTFRFVWYDVNDATDSAYVDITFTALAVGINEHKAPRHFEAYPNPSNGSNVTFSYDLGPSSAPTTLEVYDLLGARVLSKPLNAMQGEVSLSVDELTEGVWIAALERNGHTLATKRLAIIH